MEFCSAEMSFFFIGLLCMSRKKLLYRESKNFISRESFTNFTQSRFYAQKILLHVPFFAVRKKIHFHKPKVLLLHKPLRTVRKSRFFLRTKSLLFTQTFPYCYPKLLFSTLRFPFQPPLTYCLQRIRPFFCCSL